MRNHVLLLFIPIATFALGLVQPNDAYASGKMYWTDGDGETIRRADLDGSNIEDLPTAGVEDPAGIALDLTDEKIYFTATIDQFDRRGIRRANLDGSNVEDLDSDLSHANPGDIALDLTNSPHQMYWTVTWEINNDYPGIYRGNLDGSDISIHLGRLADTLGIALDGSAGKMYWTEFDGNLMYIMRADLAGSNVEGVISFDTYTGAYAIALDPTNGKIYWPLGANPQYGTPRIQRANLDGSNVEDLIDLESYVSFGIALDVSGGKMYWTDGWKIRRANLDGSDPEDLVVGDPQGGLLGKIALDLRSDLDGDGVYDSVDNCSEVANGPNEAPNNQCDTDSDGYGNACDADYNGNNYVDGLDYAIFGQNWGKPVPPGNPDVDMNCNGYIDGIDYGLFGPQWGKQPGPACGNPRGTPCPAE